MTCYKGDQFMIKTVRYKRVVVEYTGSDFLVVIAEREPIASIEYYPWVVGSKRNINIATLTRSWTKVTKSNNFHNLYDLLNEGI